jgi:hypothetical protein
MEIQIPNLLISFTIVEFICIFLMRCYSDKPDILRIFYEDIPVVYLYGINLFYILIVFHLSFFTISNDSHWYVFMGHIIIINIILKFALNISAKLLDKYDYYHLYTRYTNVYKNKKYFVVDLLYIIVITVIFVLMNKLLSNKYEKIIQFLFSLFGYALFTLTFEDL